METKDFKNKYNTSCRVCLSNSNDGAGMSALFTTTYQSMYLFDMMSSCTSIEIKPNDGLPSLICTKCMGSLIAACEFQKQCYKTDLELRIKLGIPATANAENRILEVDVKMTILQFGADIAIKNEESDCSMSPEMLENNLADQELDIKDVQCDSMGADNVANIDPFDVQPVEEPAINIEVTAAVLDSLNVVEAKRTTKKVYQCLVCKKGFSKSFNLQRHLNVHKSEPAYHSRNISAINEHRIEHTAAAIVSASEWEDEKHPASGGSSKKKYQCLLCLKNFDKAFNFHRHSKVHNELGKPFECEICKFRFAKKNLLLRHALQHTDILIETPKKKYQCLLCQKGFNKAFNFHRHSKVHNDPGKPFECEVCKFRFAKKILLMRHALKHTDILTEEASVNDNPQESPSMKFELQLGNEKYKCKCCEKTFTKLHQLRRHSVMSHDEFKLHMCHMCDQKFALASQLADHIVGHNDENPFVCSLCNKGFRNSYKLQAHMKTHCKETPFLCSECGKAFQNKANLSQHMIRHTGDKPFACKECPSRFVTKGSLRAHMSTHTQIKPYACDLCGSTFTRNYSVTKHKRVHHANERPYPCEMCDKRFHSSERLRIHIRIHTGEKPYKCELCDRAFAQSNDLVKHTRSHVGDKTYKCKDCPAAFRLFRELQRHNNMHFMALKNCKTDVKSNDSSKTFEVQQSEIHPATSARGLSTKRIEKIF